MDTISNPGKFKLPRITVEQAKDTGMALCLLFLLIGYFTGRRIFVPISILILIVNMTFPVIYRSVGRVWFGGSQLIGALMSKILLSVLFFMLVTPIGKIRRLLGGDSLNIRAWKKDQNSVFQKRFHQFGPGDLDNPY